MEFSNEIRMEVDVNGKNEVHALIVNTTTSRQTISTKSILLMRFKKKKEKILTRLGFC